MIKGRYQIQKYQWMSSKKIRCTFLSSVLIDLLILLFPCGFLSCQPNAPLGWFYNFWVLFITQIWHKVSAQIWQTFSSIAQNFKPARVAQPKQWCWFWWLAWVQRKIETFSQEKIYIQPKTVPTKNAFSGSFVRWFSSVFP